MTQPMRPLEGMTVLALEHAIAAPLASRHLADLGAEVIKIERPGSGDFARGYDRVVHGQSGVFVWLNRGKRSVTLDVKHPEAAEVLARLVSRADVVIQNLMPGAAARLGLSHAVLAPLHPKLVVCDISGYGESGPYARRKAYDLLIQAESGIISVTGTPETPARVGISVADIATGMYAQSAILAALLRRARTGEGASVKVAMLDALAEWMTHPLYVGAYGGNAPRRQVVSHYLVAPYGAHATADGSIIFGLQNEREWASFCRRIMHDEAMIADPRFATNMARCDNRAALTEAIEALFTTLPTAEVAARLDAAGIANGRLNDVFDVWEHPQLAARERWREVQTPEGPVRALLSPFDIAGQAPCMGAVPRLGADTDAVLGELGYGTAQIAGLRAAGAL